MEKIFWKEDYRMADLNKILNDLNEENAKLEEQLLRYKNYGFIPKLHIGETGFFVNIKDNKVESFVVDEICLTRIGLDYREYISESDFRLVPDNLCFTSEQEATKFLEEYNNRIA